MLGGCCWIVMRTLLPSSANNFLRISEGLAESSFRSEKQRYGDGWRVVN